MNALLGIMHLYYIVIFFMSPVECIILQFMHKNYTRLGSKLNDQQKVVSFMVLIFIKKITLIKKCYH